MPYLKFSLIFNFLLKIFDELPTFMPSSERNDALNFISTTSDPALLLDETTPQGKVLGGSLTLIDFVLRKTNLFRDIFRLCFTTAHMVVTGVVSLHG
mmetsp:Transcript_42242/g.63779  ORF Transcript_42242/g.63779 Transcript_42242/m.63779 type:complete len:97 (-) Transcript_42242:663-953(-)